MPFCPNCGHEVPEGVAFCPRCGAAQGGAVATTTVAGVSRFGEFAGFWTRVGGRLLDAVIVLIAAGLVAAIEYAIYGSPILANFVGLGYIWYFTAQGQTLGQRALGIRIIDAAGNPPGAARALGRMLASILSSIPFGLGYLWAAWHPEKRTWHDSLAGTWVIRPRG